MYRWLHPLKILMMGAILIIILVFFIETVTGFSTTLSVMELGKDSMYYAERKDWAWFVAGSIWVSIFSAAVMGCIVNLADALKVRDVRSKDFTPLAHLSRSQVEALNEWLVFRTYETEHLKTLWGEYHD